MADEKKLTNEQLDEVAGGMGNVTQAAVSAGVQAAVDQSVYVDQKKILDQSSNPWIDDITVAGQYHEGDNLQQNVQQNNVNVPGDMTV